MKNNTQQQDTEPKAKMLFNSDGFDFFVKVIVELFKIFGMILIAVFSIIGILLSANSKKETDEDSNIHAFDDTVASCDKNGTKYNADGDTI